MTLLGKSGPLSPKRGERDRTGLLLLYTAVSALLLLLAEGKIPGVTWNAPAILISFLFAAALGSVLLAYQWRAAGWAKLLVGVFVLLIMIPWVGNGNGSFFDLAIQIGIFAALALGLNIVVGLAGLLDLGYVAFFAVGAYLWGVFGSPQIGDIQKNAALASGVNPNLFWLFLALAVIAAAIVGVLIGLPVLKLKGDYLAIVTLGLGEVIRIFANNLTVYTNGPKGLTSIQSPPVGFLDSVAGALKFPPEEFKLFFLYFLVILVIGVVILVNVRLDRSRIGRAWIAIREDEVAAQAMGVPLVATKILAFATGASFAGIMGVIFAAKQQFISPESFNFFQSIGVLTMVILGGMGNIPGVILGAAAVTLLNLSVLPALSESLQSSFPNLNSNLDPAKYQRFLFGIILVLMMLFRPEGLLPTRRRQLELHHDEGDDGLTGTTTQVREPAPDSISADTARDAGPEPHSPGYATRQDDDRSGGER